MENRGKHHNRDDTVEATVTTVVESGPHGPYFAAFVTDRRNSGLPETERTKFITCSLRPEFWKEERWPEKGQAVILSDFTEKPAGWRANVGRFKRPSDEKQPSTQETGAPGAPHQQQRSRE